MNEKIEVINGSIELYNYDFLEGILPFKLLVLTHQIKRCTFIELRGNDLPKPSYYSTGEEIDTEKCDLFHRNMIEVFNLFEGLSEIIVDSYPYLLDDHFKFMLIPRWEFLSVIRMIKCRKLSNGFFRWVSNNCQKLTHFEMTCRCLPISPIYFDYEHCREIDVFYELKLDELGLFFNRNQKTLESCLLQLTNFANSVWDRNGVQTVVEAIRRCSCIQHLNLWVEAECFNIAEIILLLNLPLMTFFKFSVGVTHKTCIDYCVDEGFLKIRDIKVISLDGLFCDNLITVLKNFGATSKHINILVLSNLMGLTREVVEAIAADLTSIKILKCGTSFDADDIHLLLCRSNHLRFLAIVEGDKTFGNTSIEFFENRVVFAVKKDDINWNVVDVKHYKASLKGNEDYDWLIEESEGDMFDSDEE